MCCRNIATIQQHVCPCICGVKFGASRPNLNSTTTFADDNTNDIGNGVIARESNGAIIENYIRTAAYTNDRYLCPTALPLTDVAKGAVTGHCHCWQRLAKAVTIQGWGLHLCGLILLLLKLLITFIPASGPGACSGSGPGPGSGPGFGPGCAVVLVLRRYGPGSGLLVLN